MGSRHWGKLHFSEYGARLNSLNSARHHSIEVGTPMIPLRIGFDMDGTLADLSTAYAQIEERLFGPDLAEHDRPAPEAREAEQHRDESVAVAATTRDNRRSGDRRRDGPGHRDRVWRAIEDTPDFWTTLKPLEQGRDRAPLRAHRRAELGSVFHHAASGDCGRDRAAADAEMAYRARLSDAQRDPVVGRSRQVRGGAASRLPHRRHAAELRRRALRVVDAVDPSGRRGRSDRRHAARAVSVSAPRAASTRCSIFSCRRLKPAPIPRCSKNSERWWAGSRRAPFRRRGNPPATYREDPLKLRDDHRNVSRGSRAHA